LNSTAGATILIIGAGAVFRDTVSTTQLKTERRHCSPLIYTVFRKKTPTHIFFHISMSDV